MNNKIEVHKLHFQFINIEIILGAFIAFLVGVLFYLLSKLEGLKTYDISFTNFLNGSGTIIIIMSIFVIIFVLVYENIKRKSNVSNNVNLDSNIITVICPKCNNKFSASPKKENDFIIVECSHCGVKLRRINNK